MKKIIILLVVSYSSFSFANMYSCKSLEAPSTLKVLVGKELEAPLSSLSDDVVFQYYLYELTHVDLAKNLGFPLELYLNLKNRTLIEDKANLIQIMAYMAKIDHEKPVSLEKRKICELIERIVKNQKK